MPAPTTFSLPVAGSAPNQYATEDGLETAVQRFGDRIFDDLAAGLDGKADGTALPQRETPILTTPLVSIGGDAVIEHRPDGVYFNPSDDLRRVMAPAMMEGESEAIVPLHAIGGDLVIVYREDGIDFTPSAALRAKLGGLMQDVPSVEGGETLRRMRAKIAALRQQVAGARLRVLMVGDSWVMLPQLRAGLAAIFSAEHPLVGEGWLSANTGYARLLGSSYTASSEWAVIDGTAGGRVYGETPDAQVIHTDQAGALLTWSSLRCTRFSIYSLQHGGAWRYRVDGGSWTTVTDSGTGFKRTQITGLSDANHTIEIEAVSGRVVIGGFFMARDGVSGIEISRFGDGGARADTLQPALAAQAAVMAQEPPDLIITVLGTNDARVGEAQGSAANYMQYMSALLAQARTVQSDVSAIHVIPPRNNLSVQRPTTVYRDAIRAARLGTAYLSLTEHFDDFPQANALGLWADDVHPSPTGGRMIADLLNDLLIRI